jgi:hypothetical protein
MGCFNYQIKLPASLNHPTAKEGEQEIFSIAIEIK